MAPALVLAGWLLLRNCSSLSFDPLTHSASLAACSAHEQSLVFREDAQVSRETEIVERMVENFGERYIQFANYSGARVKFLWRNRQSSGGSFAQPEC